jgi:hypothetical protein
MSEPLTLFTGPRRAGRPRKVSLVIQFGETIRAAEHLRPEDAGLVELGRRLAAEIDAADDPKVTASLSGQYLGVLDRMLIGPKSRARHDMGDQGQEVNPFDEARRLLESRWGLPGPESGVPV